MGVNPACAKVMHQSFKSEGRELEDQGEANQHWICALDGAQGIFHGVFEIEKFDWVATLAA